MAVKWIATASKGVRYYEHPTRKHGVGADRYFAIRYTVNGRTKEEGLGWWSEGWTLDRAIAERSKLIEARRTGHGPKTLEEQRQQAAQAKAEAERQQQLDAARNVTLREYWPVYLAQAKTKKKEHSWQTEDGYFRNWIDPLLGHIPMREITLVQWDGLMDAVQDAGLSPRTKQYVALTLRQCLDHAYMRKLIPDPPPRAKHVGATLKPNSNARTRVLTNKELHSIMEALASRDQLAYNVTLFCALTGARFSEAANLTWKDVDLVAGTCTFRSTKNGTDRTIPLGETLVEFLEGLDRSKGLLFPCANGTRYKQTPTPFRDAVESLNLNADRGKRDRVTFHTLRHTAATRLAHSKVSLPDLMSLCGWKTASMALRYAHSDDESKRRAMATLERAMQQQPAKVHDIFGGE